MELVIHIQAHCTVFYDLWHLYKGDFMLYGLFEFTHILDFSSCFGVSLLTIFTLSIFCTFGEQKSFFSRRSSSQASNKACNYRFHLCIVTFQPLTFSYISHSRLCKTESCGLSFSITMFLYAIIFVKVLLGLSILGRLTLSRRSFKHQINEERKKRNL